MSTVAERIKAKFPLGTYVKMLCYIKPRCGYVVKYKFPCQSTAALVGVSAATYSPLYWFYPEELQKVCPNRSRL